MGQLGGLIPMQMSLAGIYRIDNLNSKYFVALRRDLVTGKSQLVSYDKDLRFHLSDFVFQLAAAIPQQASIQSRELPLVREVTPGSGQVHENLLRFSIHFAEPTSFDILSRLSLVRADGSIIDRPFLQQELWSPDGRILSVILGPGRVKTGLVAHDTLDRALRVGEEVTLKLDGTSLVRWSITPEWIHPINMQSWTIARPTHETKNSLQISFPEPLDDMDAILIAVLHEGTAIKGSATFNSTQIGWSFYPENPWDAGRYTILVHPHLEDPYGNQVGSGFETPQTLSQLKRTSPVELFFDVR